MGRDWLRDKPRDAFNFKVAAYLFFSLQNRKILKQVESVSES
jgi:hypothetical protein